MTGEVTGPYIERRWRSCLGALAARQAEQKALGADYDPESLEGREYAYVLVWELAGLIGTWSDSHYGHAISTSAQALRAAFWLWLEDDERAMMVAEHVSSPSLKPARGGPKRPGASA